MSAAETEHMSAVETRRRPLQSLLGDSLLLCNSCMKWSSRIFRLGGSPTWTHSLGLSGGTLGSLSWSKNSGQPCCLIQPGFATLNHACRPNFNDVFWVQPSLNPARPGQPLCKSRELWSFLAFPCTVTAQPLGWRSRRLRSSGRPLRQEPLFGVREVFEIFRTDDCWLCL